MSPSRIRVLTSITRLELGGAQKVALHTAATLDPSAFESGLAWGPGDVLDSEAQDADNMARMREGDTQESVPASAPAQAVSADAASLGYASEASAPGHCDETATATPETWLQCITSLEEAGLTDVADEERKLLAAAFPDFDAP